MATGWIKLYRILLEKEIFQDAYVLKTFLYLLLKATYKESKIKVGNRSIELQPGQLLYGRKSVSQKLNIGEGKLRGIMKYLAENGSIKIDAYSKYSIVTIVNWMEYQCGVVPEFPFDIDFLDDEDGNEDMYEDYADYEDAYEEVYTEEFSEEYPESQPAKNQVQMQSGTGFQNYEDEFLTSREPQYNNINKYKNNIIKNKTKENKNKIKQEKIKENKNIENHKNIKHQNTENISNIQNMKTSKTSQNRSLNRQNCNAIYELARSSAPRSLPKVAGLDTSQEMLYSGGGISKGKVGFTDSADRYDSGSSCRAFAAPAACSSVYDDDDAIDAHLLFDVDF